MIDGAGTSAFPGPLRDDLEIARRAAVGAGGLIQAAFGSPLEVQYKSLNQPVTEADLQANEYLRSALLEARKDYGWLSEETAERPVSRTGKMWVVDPLDGTTNFVARVPEFAVCVGLLDHGIPMLGVVYNPVTGKLYHAVRGQGAFRNDEPVQARPFHLPSLSLVASKSEIASGLLGRVEPAWTIQGLGSTALKMMRVAEGGADLYISRSPKGIWDLVATAVIAREAGAAVLTLDGNALDFRALNSVTGLAVVGPGGEGRVRQIVEQLGTEQKA